MDDRQGFMKTDMQADDEISLGRPITKMLPAPAETGMTPIANSVATELGTSSLSNDFAPALSINRHNSSQTTAFFLPRVFA
jgi:hypothetical protein